MGNSGYHSIQNILSSCLAGCESSCFMLKEAHRFMVFEKRVLQRIFGSGRVEVT